MDYYDTETGGGCFLGESHGDFIEYCDLVAERSRFEREIAEGAGASPYADPVAERDGNIAARRDFEQRVAAAEEARIAAYDDCNDYDEEYDND